MRFEVAASADDRTIDAEDPQDAAETYAAQRGLHEPTRVWVREPGAPAWSMEAPGLDMCRDVARDDLDAALSALEAP